MSRLFMDDLVRVEATGQGDDVLHATLGKRRFRQFIRCGLDQHDMRVVNEAELQSVARAVTRDVPACLVEFRALQTKLLSRSRFFFDSDHIQAFFRPPTIEKVWVH